MAKKGTILFLLLALSSLSGCNYFKNRVYDWMDVSTFNISGGEGALIHARFTKIFQFGGGVTTDAMRVGWRGRKALVWRETRDELGFGPIFYYTHYRLTPVYGWSPLKSSKKVSTTDIDWDMNEDRHWFSFGIVGHLMGGIEFALNPAELGDFLAGFVFLDPFKDDIQRPKKKKDGEEEENEEEE